MTINFAIFAAFVAAAIIALTTFLQDVSATLDEIIVTSVPIIPYFIPSNFLTCITAYVGVELACVTYSITTNWIANKAFIFKA